MKVYFAAAYTARDLLREWYVPALERAGHACSSGWLRETHPITPGTVGAALEQPGDYLLKHIDGDITDVVNSDALILFTEAFMKDIGIKPPYATGGRHVETGIALAMQIPVIVLGEPENIFHRAGVSLVPTWDGATKALDLIETTATQLERLF